MWVPDRVGHLADDLGQLLLDAGVDALADPRRQVAPQIRMLALHDPLDHVVHVAASRLEDVLGDPVGLELLVELRRAAELRDPLVDRDRPHLGGARGDDPLPADAAVHDAWDLLDLPRQERHDRSKPRHPEPLEVDGVEQHPDAAPVRRVADRAREDRDGYEVEKLVAHQRAGDSHRKVSPSPRYVGTSSAIESPSIR